jgi:hypothetical protein
MNKKPQDAWELYLKMEASPESHGLLQLIANDCYKMGHFYHSAKAFDMLERFDPNPEYWEGKRGACIGMFQKVIACEEPKYALIIIEYYLSMNEGGCISDLLVKAILCRISSFQTLVMTTSITTIP